MAIVGYARVSSTGRDLTVQLEKLKGCDKVFQEKRSGVDAGRPELKACLEFLREGRYPDCQQAGPAGPLKSDLYRIISAPTEKGVAFKVIDDPSIDTTSRTGKLIMGTSLSLPNSRMTFAASGRWTASGSPWTKGLGSVASLS